MKNRLILTFAIFLLVACGKRDPWQNAPFFWGFAMEGFPITAKNLDLQKNESGVSPEVVLFYMNWTSSKAYQDWLVDSLNVIWDQKAVPCLTWEPMITENNQEMMIPYQHILNGSYDPYIDRIAELINAWKKPLIVRFAHEMNIKRYHWGTTLEEFGPNSPDIYKQMFQYVVERFKAKNVKNIFWAFCPNVDSIPNEPWNAPANFYPGDAYVDIFGMDGYNWNIDAEVSKSKNINWTSPWRSFENTFAQLYQQLKQLAPNKPIIVFETASTERKGSQTKAEWIDEAIKTSRNWGILGIVWFQVNKEEEWKISRTDARFIPDHKSTFQSWLQSLNES
jgi:hypothetical protein